MSLYKLLGSEKFYQKLRDGSYPNFLLQEIQDTLDLEKDIPVAAYVTGLQQVNMAEMSTARADDLGRLTVPD